MLSSLLKPPQAADLLPNGRETVGNIYIYTHGVVGGKCQYFTLSSFKYIYI